MRTLKTTQNYFKSTQILVASLAVAFFTFFIFSCSETENVATLDDDTALIEKIETSAKITVQATDLPSTTAIAFNDELIDSAIETVLLASDFGYKVALITDNASREEAKSEVFFNLQGRQLNDLNERRAKKRRKCFEFVFPIDFVMPDATIITLNEKADWKLIRTWYQDNPATRERATLVFPVDITLKEDGSTQTLLDKEDLIAVKQNCRAGKDKRKCFRLVLPISYTMPDNTVIEVNERADFRLVRAWYKANTDVTTKGTLNFPIEILFKDDTTATIADQAAFDAAKESCTD